jgi:hypothetical protein
MSQLIATGMVFLALGIGQTSLIPLTIGKMQRLSILELQQ